MGYRRDRGKRATRRILVATALAIAPAIHGCGKKPDVEEPMPPGNPKGSFHDDAMIEPDAAPPPPSPKFAPPPDAGPPDVAPPPRLPKPDIIYSNPKGSFHDPELIEPTAPDKHDGDDE